jgi:hypothetical protein
MLQSDFSKLVPNTKVSFEDQYPVGEDQNLIQSQISLMLCENSPQRNKIK